MKKSFHCYSKSFSLIYMQFVSQREVQQNLKWQTSTLKCNLGAHFRHTHTHSGTGVLPSEQLICYIIMARSCWDENIRSGDQGRALCFSLQVWTLRDPPPCLSLWDQNKDTCPLVLHEHPYALWQLNLRNTSLPDNEAVALFLPVQRAFAEKMNK